LYSHLRFVIAASLIAFGSVIAVGMPALLLSVDRPLVTRADVSDPPASSSCKQHGWLHFDRNCLSRRDLPWVAGRGGADAAMTEAPTEPNGQSAEPSLTENRQAATIHHEPVPPDSVPELFMPQVSVPQNLTLQEPASREAPPQQISPQAGTPAESGRPRHRQHKKQHPKRRRPQNRHSASRWLSSRSGKERSRRLCARRRHSDRPPRSGTSHSPRPERSLARRSRRGPRAGTGPRNHRRTRP
jgi:hypothetical protein